MSIIQDFIDITEGTDVPLIFRKWIGVGLVAAAMGRRTHAIMDVAKGPFYPNHFIVLVGEPGIGKTIALKRAQDIMSEADIAELGPNKISPQKLLSKLADMSAEPERDEKDALPRADAVIALFLDEFGSLVSKYDPDFMEIMSELWNSPSHYEYDTHKRGSEELHNVCINLVAGTQPSWFTEGFNSITLEQGFPARLWLIYSDEVIKTPSAFNASKADHDRLNNAIASIAAKLQRVARMRGQFGWTSTAKQMFNKLHAEDFQPIPTEPLLRHYSTRRHFHLAKLAMVVAASNHQRLRIEGEDLEEAWEMMLEAERGMAGALVSAGGNKYRPAEQAAMEYIKTLHAHSRKPVPEYKVRKFLSASLNGQEVDQLIETLIKQDRFIIVGKPPTRRFKPKDG